MRGAARWISLAFFGPFCALQAQSPLPPPVLKEAAASPGALILIRSRAIDNLDHQPNYTCTETIERSMRTKATHKIQLIDTIRLEVALVNGKEMYAWPGSSKFEDQDMRNFAKDGAIGNGSFALHARAVFSGEASRFEYVGTGNTKGREWIRYNYHVPLARSGYSIGNGQDKAVVPYHGSFEADPGTLDLQRMEVIADELPPVLRMQSATNTVEYVRTKIGSAEFLLPSESELTMVNADGSEMHNHLRFASCRQFAGESTVRFDDAPTNEPAAPKEIVEVVLPGDMAVMLALIEDLDLTKVAVGDPIRAELKNDLKAKGRMLIGKRAIATGRITRLERHSESTMLGLTFDDLQGDGVHARLNIKLDGVMNADRITLSGRFLLAPRQPREGIIPFGPGRAHVNRGLLMNWSTER